MKAHYHLPGLFEFYEFYKIFLPIYYNHPDWFYDWCDIGSIYGAPADCIWGGGRTGFGQSGIEKEVYTLCRDSGISARLTFSNSLIEKNHLDDKKCNELCRLFERNQKKIKNGIIIHSDLLLNYLKSEYPDFYFISSTTKCITDFSDLNKELERPEFCYVVPDFRLNKDFQNLSALPQNLKNKVEFLSNECCWVECGQRKQCYENVSLKSLGLECPEHKCAAPGNEKGYVFSKAMESPAFISLEDIQKTYMPMGFSNFKIEGRSLGSALLLEFILYYMTKPDAQLKVREEIYLDNTLDLF
ncbi:MAG: hypothetical protein MJ185_07805 [Treponema sp.]|nr:hypothetical protein [Treponema sp.]